MTRTTLPPVQRLNPHKNASQYCYDQGDVLTALKPVTSQESVAPPEPVRTVEESITSPYVSVQKNQAIQDRPNSGVVHQSGAGNVNNGQSEGTISTSSASVAKNQQTVLLQTAYALASANPGDASVCVRILFDSGSQLSYHRM